eukprot:COSAG02_NODE_25161_length_667_cov_0.875000_2_plen_113_part_00
MVNFSQFVFRVVSSGKFWKRDPAGNGAESVGTPTIAISSSDSDDEGGGTGVGDGVGDGGGGVGVAGAGAGSGGRASYRSSFIGQDSVSVPVNIHICTTQQKQTYMTDKLLFD